MWSFIYLSAFSSHGGIERFNRAFIKALSELSDEVCIYSLYDQKEFLDKKYVDSNISFRGKKTSKVIDSIIIVLRLLFSSGPIIWGHLNLYPLGKIISIFQPKRKQVLIAHGIDIWLNTSDSKRKFLNGISEIWTVSEYTKNRLSEIYALNTNKIKVFQNTLDPFLEEEKPSEKPSFLLDRYKLNRENKVVLTVARLSAEEGYKGYDRALEAIAKLNSSSLRYFIVGKYDEIERQRLLVKAKELGIQSQLILCGFVSDAELMAHYQLADVFVMPSTDEGFGIVFIEALACGTPVIGGNQDGSVDALAKGKLGTLVDPMDTEAIAKSIQMHLDNSFAKSFAAQNDRIRTVWTTFGFQAYKSRLKDLLKNLE